MTSRKAEGARRSELIEYRDGRLVVPPYPVIPFIEGDGIGPEIMAAAHAVLDAGVRHAYGRTRSIVWREVLAGEKAKATANNWLPDTTIEAIRQCRVGLKGPLTTPTGGGIRSLNVRLRQLLDLYACIRPVRYIPGAPSPLTHPEHVDMVIVRENTEDVYAGFEVAVRSREAAQLRDLLGELGMVLREDSAIGIKPISIGASKRLVRKAIRYALDGRRNVTLVHKGNIMKFTEGAFKQWGYEVAREEFGDRTVTEDEVQERGDSATANRVVVKDRLADAVFQQILLRPQEFDVLATTNLNGDYLSDFLAAQIGGLGMAPGSNEGDGIAVFEAAHGSAPKYAGQDRANPSSLILSGVMMLRWLGWREAASAVERAVAAAINQRQVTQDLARQLEDVAALKTSEYARAIIGHLSNHAGTNHRDEH